VVVTNAVVVVTAAVVVVITDTFDAVDAVDAVGLIVGGAGFGSDDSPAGGRRASTTVTSTASDPDVSDPWSTWLTTNATTTAATTTPYVTLERCADTSCSSRGRTARS
jgi:hypothetical protein